MAPDRGRHWWRRSAPAALTVLALVAGTVAVANGSRSAAAGAQPLGSASAASAGVPGDWLTFDYDALRSGVGPRRTGITAGNLHRLRRRTVQLGGTVDSAPVELHAVRVRGRTRDVVIVTTTYGRTIAVDARTGARLWRFQPSGYGQLAGSAQITTATPVIDPDRAFVYAASPNGFIHKLSIANGRPVWSTRITFDPMHEKIAGALNISEGAVVAVTGGYYGDAPPYQGHVVKIDTSNGRITAVWNSLCSNRPRLIDPPSSCPASDSAIFGRSGSVIEADGDILVATGNGPFNGSTDWGDSVLELSSRLKLLHNYTPVDQAYLNRSDTDLGSTSPAVLGENGRRPLAVMGGKDGILKLLDLDRLDGTQGPAGPRTGGQLQKLPTPGSAPMFTVPSVWTARSGRINVFIATTAGTTDYVLRGGRLHVAWQNGTAGTSPIVAGGLLYVYDESNGALDVYRPSSGALLARLPAAGGHWNSPIVVGRRIILPVGDANDHARVGTLIIYHLPGA